MIKRFIMYPTVAIILGILAIVFVYCVYKGDEMQRKGKR